MGLGYTVLAAPLMMMLAAADLDADTTKNFEKIADSVAMAQTCRQHDFTVDDAGISDLEDPRIGHGCCRRDERSGRAGPAR